MIVHSDLSWRERMQLDAADGESLLRDFLDADGVGADDESTIDELLERARERMAEERERAQQEHAAEAAARKSNRRETAAAARRAEEAKAVGQSVRDIYRKLVSSLHPDRESDPLERARKTLLMQDINRAYQGNDLLTLLNLQMQVEQIDAATLAQLPAQRLQHYNQVLREQFAALNSELRARIEDLGHLVGSGSFGLREPSDAELLFRQQVRALRAAQAQLQQGIAALANPRLQVAEIDAIVRMMGKHR